LIYLQGCDWLDFFKKERVKKNDLLVPSIVQTASALLNNAPQLPTNVGIQNFRTIKRGSATPRQTFKFGRQ
jgi:hypothetical protein